MSSFIDEINKDILERVEEIESPDYVFPERFKKGDYIGLALVAAICLIGSIAVIIYGASV